MRTAELLELQIKKKITDAAVALDYGTDGTLVLTVTAESFGLLRPMDREARVYDSLSRVPLETLARIGRILCQVAS